MLLGPAIWYFRRVVSAALNPHMQTLKNQACLCRDSGSLRRGVLIRLLYAALPALAFACILPLAGLAQPLFEAGARVLFQGDSITDMGRGRTEDPNHILGHSYVFIIAAGQGAAFPVQGVTFINRGVSGNTLADLAVRWQADAIALKPDVLSILIGINDVGHSLKRNQPVSIDDYERTYDRLLGDTIAALPKVRLVLCEPFLAPGKSTSARFGEWQAAINAMDGVVGRLAAKYHAPVVHFSRVFDEAFKRAPVDHWIWDGVHPTYSGHQLMADEWERAYRAFYGAPAISGSQPPT